MTATSSNSVSHSVSAAPAASTLAAPTAPAAPLSGPAAVLDLSAAAQKYLGHTDTNVPWGNSPVRNK